MDKPILQVTLLVIRTLFLDFQFSIHQIGKLTNHETGKYVKFDSPHLTNPIFIVSVQEVTPYLDTDTMTLKNTTLDQSVQEKLNSLSANSLRPDTYYKLIRQNKLTVGENMSWKIEYNFDIFYTFEIMIINNGKLYTLTYSELPLYVPKTLPLANKMVETFQFIGVPY
jgi:hypothetical protein